MKPFKKGVISAKKTGRNEVDDNKINIIDSMFKRLI